MEVFDRAVALGRAEGDAAVLKERAASFLKHAPGQVASLQKALKRKKVDQAEPLVRELKEQARNLGAAGTEHVCDLILTACRSGSAADAAAELYKLQMEVDWLRRVLDENMCSGNL